MIGWIILTMFVIIPFIVVPLCKWFYFDIKDKRYKIQ